jgi:hypothetical protein
MRRYPNAPRRLILAGGFAVAIAVTPAVAILAHPMQPTDSKPMAACASGEEEDVFTTTCTPILVPNSPSQGFTSTAANPNIPEINGVPCTGRDSGACIGLSEDNPGPQPVPVSTFSSSP